MRDPHCIQCGQYITHFGKGWKYSIVKIRGRYCHEQCYEIYKSSKKRRVYAPEVRKIWNQRYWAKVSQFRHRRKHNYYWNMNLVEQ